MLSARFPTTAPLQLSFAGLTLAVVFATQVLANAPPSSTEWSKTFPSRLGDFRQVEFHKLIFPGSRQVYLPDNSSQIMPIFVGESDYASVDGRKFHIAVIKWDSDSKAFANLTGSCAYQRSKGQACDLQIGNIGTASATANDGIAFFNGPAFVTITSANGNDLTGA